MEGLKHDDREKIEKEGGVMHSFSPEERMSFSQLISFNHRGDPDLGDILPIDPNSMELFNAVGTGILLCKMVNHAVPGTIDAKLINLKKPLNVFQIKENLSQAIKGAQQIGCHIISITPPLIMEKREHIILGLIWQVLKATLGLQVNLKNQPNMIRLKKENEPLASFQNLPTEEMLLRWLNHHLRNAASGKVAKNFSSDLKDANIYTIVLNQLEPSKCDLSGLGLSEEERAHKVIEDSVKCGIPRFLRPEDILAGNPKLNLIFCGEMFNHIPGLVAIQPVTEGDRMAFSELISENHKEEEQLKSKLPINPNSKDLLAVSRDGQLLTKMMNRAVPNSVDEEKTVFGENNDEKTMISNLENFLSGAEKSNVDLSFVKPTMIIDQLEDIVLTTIWEVLKKEADRKVNPASDANLLRLKNPEESLEDFNKVSGAQHFLLRWINYHLQNAGKFKPVENFKDHLKDGTVYTVLLNQLDDAKCDKSGLDEPEEARIAKAIDNAAQLGVPKFLKPKDVLEENDKLNLLFSAEIYYRNSGLRPVENVSDNERIGLAILLSERHKGDEDLQKYLPINPESKDLFSTTANSVLLAKMIEKADPNALDLGQIAKGENVDKDQQEENLQKSLDAAKKLGCDVKNIGVPAIVNQVPDLVLKVLNEILKADLRNHLNTDNVPLLAELKRPDESLESFNKINDPEHYLLRWINHHLKNAGSDKEVKNFGPDLKDGTAYTILLNQLEPAQCDTSGLDKSEEERAEKVINDAALLGVPKFLSPKDILNENANLNLLFAAEIFARNNGLEPKKEFCQEEKKCYAQIINDVLKDDADLADVLPINPDSNALFANLKDGIILNKLVNDAVPGTIDPRAINTKKPLTPFQVNENLQLGIASAKSVGCKIDEITPQDVLKGKEAEDLKLISEILKAKIREDLNLKNHPYLIRLKKPEEEPGDLLKLSPEDLLKRWFNHHLKNAGNDKGIENFGPDLADCKNFTLLINQLEPSLDKSGLDDDLNKRAEKVIENAKTLGVNPFIRVEDLLVANPTLNFLLAFNLFKNKPGLTINEEEKIEAAGLLKDDVGDSREERSFRMWVNSLKIPDVYVNNLFEDIKDGIVLLKVLDRVEPGSVDWKKVEMKPTIRLKKIQNANLAVEIGKHMKFSLVNVGGIDLVDGKKKLVLALIWQMVRKHTLQLLGGWSEDKLLEWALERVQKDPKINSFKDKSIANCQFLFNLLASIEHRIINWDLVTPGNTPEEVENNCNYVLSVARKLGAVIFLVWEDIKDVNPKMIMTLFAALVRIVKSGKQEEMIDFTKKTVTDL